MNIFPSNWAVPSWLCQLFEDFLLCLAEFTSADGLEKPLEFFITQKNIVIPETVTYEKKIEILKYISKK